MRDVKMSNGSVRRSTLKEAQHVFIVTQARTESLVQDGFSAVQIAAMALA
jgi:hypothetical protein